MTINNIPFVYLFYQHFYYHSTILCCIKHITCNFHLFRFIISVNKLKYIKYVFFYYILYLINIFVVKTESWNEGI